MAETNFTPDRKRGFRSEDIGRPECPYLHRWVAQFGKFSVRVHHWMGSDDPRHFHDHQWWFLTLVLKGGYTDISSPNPEAGVTSIAWEQSDEPGAVQLATKHHEKLSPGSVRFRPALHTHTVQVDPGGCWTLMITGPPRRDWGFWVNGIWKRQRKYFRDHGHHPCEEGRSA